MCEMRVQPPHRQRARALLLELVGPARSEAGNLSYEVFEDRDDPNKFDIVDGWATESSCRSHHDSVSVARVVAQLNPLLEGEYTENVAVRSALLI